MPSTQALCPPMKKGTSAPSVRPSWSSRERGQCSPHNRFSAISVVAASELPPPSPAPHGTCLSLAVGAPSVGPLAKLAVEDMSVYNWQEDAGEIRIVNLQVAKNSTTTVRQYWRKQGSHWQIFSEDVLS